MDLVVPTEEPISRFDDKGFLTACKSSPNFVASFIVSLDEGSTGKNDEVDDKARDEVDDKARDEVDDKARDEVDDEARAEVP